MIATEIHKPSSELIEACKANLPRFNERLRAAWRYIEPPDICEWVEDSLRFGRGDGVQLESRIGPYSFTERPWWRFPLRCLADRKCVSVAMPAATQIGKTANLDIAAMLYYAEFFPAPGMAILPDEGEAKKFRDRVYAIAEESAKFTRFNRIRVPGKRDRNMQEIHLGSMLIHLAWAGSKQRTRGKPCWYVWFIECDVYRDRDKKAGDPVEAGKQRTKDVYRYKHIFESSPSETPSAVCDEFDAADEKYAWFGKCPHCGQWQELRFFPIARGDFAGKAGFCGIKSKDGEWMTPEAGRESAHYVCLRGCKITDENKPTLVEHGGWGIEGSRLDIGDELPELTPPRTAGFRLWGINSPNETFGSIAEDYLRARKNGKLVDYFGNRLGRSYSHDSKSPTWYHLGQKGAFTHARRTVPDQAWFLTAGIDIQGENNGVRYVVRGWAPGRTSWLIDWGWINRTPGDEGDLVKSDMAQLEASVVQCSLPVVDGDNRPSATPLGRSEVRVKLANCDSNYLPFKVHHWMRTLPESWLDRVTGDTLLPGRVRAIRGDHKVSPDVRFRHALVESNTRTGEKYEGGLHQWGLCVYPYYDILTEAIASDPGKEGSWYLTADILKDGRDYLEQVTNFHYVVEVDPVKGKKGAWRPKNHRIPVDFWDCEIYALAAAEMVVGELGWDVKNWEQWKAKATQSKPRRAARETRGETIGAR